jgi:hypothetical protein
MTVSNVVFTINFMPMKKNSSCKEKKKSDSIADATSHFDTDPDQPFSQTFFYLNPDPTF